MATLYGARGGGVNSNLYTINPATAATTSVGSTGHTITGLAQHPGTSVVYAITGNADATPHSLYTVNLGTGALTLVGDLGLTLGDITFDSGGVLYGFATQSPRRLYTINLSTGAATVVGSSANVGGYGMGLACDASDVLDLFPDGDTGDFWTVNRLTGVPTDTGIALTGGPFGDGAAVSAAAWPPNFAALYAVLNDFPTSALVWINLTSGVITNVGTLPDDFDALAWTGTGGPPPPAITASVIFDSAMAFKIEA